MARPVLALLTDFGLLDHYVGAMKGVILGICPDATIIDITHDIPPQDVVAGALELQAAARYFPEGTVFVAVVDPGVGSARRAVAVESGGRLFVGPDNGVLAPAVASMGPSFRAVALEEQQYARSVVSRTFEGRDRFAPAAAWLATGVDLSALGSALAALASLDLPQPTREGSTLHGIVMRIDHFGNLTTNITRDDLDAPVELTIVRIAGTAIGPVRATYSDVGDGAPCALFSSTDHLEVAVRGGSAAARFGVERGDPVQVHRRSAA